MKARRARPPPILSEAETGMQWRLRKKHGPSLYARRKALIEAVFALVKRAWGFG